MGCVFNLKKLALAPTQKIEFLGVLVDSTSMTFFLTKAKLLNVQKQCQEIVHKAQVLILELTKLIGFFIFHNLVSIINF